MARKSKYDTDVKPYIEDIRKAVEAGATVEEVAKAFSINRSTLYNYIKEKPELKDAFARGRVRIVFEIKAALLKKAMGYDYTETKRVAKHDINGQNIVLVETYRRHLPASETAAAMLLRNYDPEWLDKDAVQTELKKQEVELRKAIAESQNFDIELGGQ